jgi:hypothetical protein
MILFTWIWTVVKSANSHARSTRAVVAIVSSWEGFSLHVGHVIEVTSPIIERAVNPGIFKMPAVVVPHSIVVAVQQRALTSVALQVVQQYQATPLAKM